MEEELKEMIQNEEDSSYYPFINGYETLYKNISRDSDSGYQTWIGMMQDY
jgi:hypothetical protein